MIIFFFLLYNVYDWEFLVFFGALISSLLLDISVRIVLFQSVCFLDRERHSPCMGVPLGKAPVVLALL